MKTQKFFKPHNWQHHSMIPTQTKGNMAASKTLRSIGGMV